MEKDYVKLAMSDIQSDSIVDGEGIRSVIWFQGCTHKCPGCHNAETHDFNLGTKKSLEEIKKEIEGLEYQSGITFSGGDPMMQPEALLDLAKHTHKCGMNVWCYTGFTFEELMKKSLENKIFLEVLKEIDVLVDGRFILNLKSFDAIFRGSSNQRIIDVKKSLEQGKVVLIEKYI